MKKIMLCSFLLSIQYAHSLRGMDKTAILSIETTLEHGRKQELLKIVKKDKVRFIGYHREEEPLIKEKAEPIIQHLASIDPALSIDDAEPDNPTLIVDLSKIIPYPHTKREVVEVEKPVQNLLQKVLNNPEAVRFLHDGDMVSVTNVHRDQTIGTIKKVLATIREDEKGPIIDLSALSQLTNRRQAPERPSLWQSLGVPLIKGSLLIAAGYLLHTWKSGQEN